MRFERGDTALFYEMVSVLRAPPAIRPVIVLNVLLMDVIRYNVLCGADKLIAGDDELFESYAAIEQERKRRAELYELFNRLSRQP